MSPLSIFLVGVATLCSLSPASADDWTHFQKKYIVKVAANELGDDFCTKTIKTMDRHKAHCISKYKFINEKPETILAVCITKSNEFVESEAAYNVIECALDGVSKSSKCVYTTKVLKRHIVLKCGDKQPVNFRKILDN